MANNYGGYCGNRDNRDSRRGGQNRGDNRRGDDYRNDGRDERDNRRGYPSGNRNRSTKDRVEPKIDKDGFTEVAKGTGTNFKYGSTPKILSRDSKPGTSRDNKSARSGDRQSQKQHQKKAPIAEPAPPPKPVAEPMNEDKLKLRAKNMRNEYMQENNQEELILSMDDLKATPNAGHVIVQASLDTAIDCKEAEREAIIAILSILYRNNKLTATDISAPFAEIVEFIDSFVVDSPRALEYLGDLMAEFLKIQALDVNWLCTQAKKLEEFSAHLIPSVIENCVKSSSNRFNVDFAKDKFGSATDAITGLIGVDKWTEIESKYGLK